MLSPSIASCHSTQLMTLLPFAWPTRRAVQGVLRDVAHFETDDALARKIVHQTQCGHCEDKAE